MKTAQGGYKAMIRDRIPRTVDAALKWCKAKTYWIDYVYDTWVWWLSDKKDKDFQVRCLLGISKKNRTFSFRDTIIWEDLNKEELEYWNSISKWVSWFERNIISIADMYETLLITKGGNEEKIKEHICKTKLSSLSPEWQDKLYKYLLEHIKKYYV